jgi:glycosyltransferase involved in cell wall biosynthesis
VNPPLLLSININFIEALLPMGILQPTDKNQKGKTLKIAFVNQPWSVVVPPVEAADSIAIWTYQVARRLVPDCDVILYAQKCHALKSMEEHQGIQYRRVPADIDRPARAFRLLDRWQLLPAERPFFASKLYYLGYILQVAKDLRKQQCDIVHIHNFSQFVPIVRLFNPQIKIVLHMHCEWLTQLDPVAIAKRLEQVDLVVGCSEYITEKIRKKFPQFSGRCQTVFNGVDAEYFANKNEKKHQQDKNSQQLIFVGRISPEKGLHVLLDAFEKVLYFYPQAQLKILGYESIAAKEFIVRLSDDPKVTELDPLYSGSYLEHLKGKLSAKMADRISFLGGVGHSEVLPHYWDADVLINPSLSEAFGMSLVEGMATETSVVGAKVGGMTGIVEDGKTGFLVEPADATALANALIRLLSDRELRESMGKAGRERVLELFSWERVAESLLRQYRNICA